MIKAVLITTGVARNQPYSFASMRLKAYIVMVMPRLYSVIRKLGSMAFLPFWFYQPLRDETGHTDANDQTGHQRQQNHQPVFHEQIAEIHEPHGNRDDKKREVPYQQRGAPVDPVQRQEPAPQKGKQQQHAEHIAGYGQGQEPRHEITQLADKHQKQYLD